MRLSIVIPTLDEENALGALLPAAIELADEVWVADGGSEDRTLEVARGLGARTVLGPAGRGVQLNQGGRAASGEVILFLHADTRLPSDAREQIRTAIDGGAIGGGFLMRFDDRRGILRLGERLINLRTRLTGCPLGDQAQFVVRQVFEDSQGFREWPILEDLDFVRRLKRRGKTVVLPGPVTTAARRFVNQGIARTIATNWLIWGLYFLGLSPERLAVLYRHIR